MKGSNRPSEQECVVRPFRIEREGRTLVLRRRLTTTAATVIGGGFVTLWLTLWTFGCVMLARQFLSEPGLQNFLFATPFFASWLAAAAVLAVLLAGEEELRLGPGGLEYRWRAIVTLRRRSVPLDQVRV